MRRTLIVEIEPHREDKDHLLDDVRAVMAQYGAVIALEWVRHNDNEED